MQRGIANILHRETIAVIVGSQTFERGEQCFSAGRVEKVEAGPGELRGLVRPNEAGRARYVVRMWLREEGMAYECTCPIGTKRVFCKHTVAIALSHLETERIRAEEQRSVLRQALDAVRHDLLVDGLMDLARGDTELSNSLKRLCLDALSKQT